MSFCLMPEAISRFKKGLIDGTIDPAKLAKMSSEERHSFFSKIVGEDGAKGVNAQFESKLLLKNQQRGFITWAKNVSGISQPAKRDILSRIQRMDRVLNPAEEEQFMKDLASTKLGFDVSREQSQTIASLSKDVADKEAKVSPEGVFKSKADAEAYGMARVKFDNYVQAAKEDASKIGFNHPLMKAKDAVKATPGLFRSVVSSLDDSFFGRQGVKVLLDPRTSHIWVKNFAKSFGDIGKELRGINAIDPIKAQIYAMPNSLNGKFRAGGYGLNALHEDAYPSQLPEKIPLFKRLFKASESAYNGGALRLRADLANRYIAIAEKHGINTLDKEQARGLGTVIGGITGRGELGRGADTANVLLFSARFLKANVDTLTAHAFDKTATPYARKLAAQNLAAIVGSMAGLLATAHALNPKSVELDPRSTHFAKIKVFGHWTDISGGMGSLVTLASRLLPITEHDGKFGFYQKTASGNITNLTDPAYGKQTALDVANQFAEGKFAPVPGILRDIWAGKNYSGQKTSPSTIAKGELPITLQNVSQLKDGKNADLIGSLIIDGLGFSVSGSAAQKVNWKDNPTTETSAFQKHVSAADLTKANNQYNTELARRTSVLTASPTYKAYSDARKIDALNGLKTDVRNHVFSQYNFKYKKAAADKGYKQSKKNLINSTR